MAHLQPFAVAQTSSSPAGCTAMPRGASPAPPSPITALACGTKLRLNSTDSEPGKPINRGGGRAGQPDGGRFRTRGEGEREHSLASKPSTSRAAGEPAAPARPYAANTRAGAAADLSSRRRIHAAHATFPPPAAGASPPSMGSGCGGPARFSEGFRALQGEPASRGEAESSAVPLLFEEREGWRWGSDGEGEPKTTTKSCAFDYC